MKYWLLITCFVLAHLSYGQGMAAHHPKRILVKFSDRSMLENIDIKANKFNIPQLDQMNAKNNVIKIRSISASGINNTYSIEFQNPVEIAKTVYSYYDTRLFDFVEPDYIGRGGGELVPNDEHFNRQWALKNNGTFDLGPTPTIGADIEMEAAWDITTGDRDLIIAILDSGLKLNHPEFYDRLWTDDNGNFGWDFANEDDLPADDQGHGTNVTSIIGANADNSNGYAGVNWNSKLMTLKILNDNNTGYYSWWASAIYFAADNGARVLNMSVGGSSYSAVMEDAINYATNKGAIVVACMMNENSDKKYYPAAYDNTIAVGATNPDDTRADQFPWNTSKGSSYGDHIDLSAPGNYIYGLDYKSNSNYDSYWSGTSQATPYVTGVVSLLLSIDPELTLESVRSILTNSAEDGVGRPTEDLEGFDPYHGYGRLNAKNALSALLTNTEEVVKSKRFSISPNPIAKGENLHIDFPSAEERIVSIFDTTGRLVAMNKTHEASYDINSSNFERGTYIIKVQSKNTDQGSAKFSVE